MYDINVGTYVWVFMLKRTGFVFAKCGDFYLITIVINNQETFFCCTTGEFDAYLR